jgi:hypothetical protein
MQKAHRKFGKETAMLPKPRLIASPCLVALFLLLPHKTNLSIPVGARLSSVYFALQTSWDAPAPSEKINLKYAEEALAQALGKVNRFYQQVFPSYQKEVDEAGVKLFEAYEPLGFDEGK